MGQMFFFFLLEKNELFFGQKAVSENGDRRKRVKLLNELSVCECELSLCVYMCVCSSRLQCIASQSTNGLEK
jgi:hypothetical protein